jgi:hypothetical protein
MIEVTLCNGQVLRQAETLEEQLAMAPEAKLREMFRGDVDGMKRFHDRLRDLDQRFDRWRFRKTLWAVMLAFPLPVRRGRP